MPGNMWKRKKYHKLRRGERFIKVQKWVIYDIWAILEWWAIIIQGFLRTRSVKFTWISIPHMMPIRNWNNYTSPTIWRGFSSLCSSQLRIYLIHNINDGYRRAFSIWYGNMKHLWNAVYFLTCSKVDILISKFLIIWKR